MLSFYIHRKQSRSSPINKDLEFLGNTYLGIRGLSSLVSLNLKTLVYLLDPGLGTDMNVSDIVVRNSVFSVLKKIL